ncbi:MAG: hypothetical protein KF687_15240 [Cyclobacteriaceae bacterium]|nr:hypothetical protein [Cyclobacteriaceae bacterium]
MKQLIPTMLSISLAIIHVFNQIPTDIPNQSTPIDLTSTTDIILFITLPLIMIVLYVYWRKKKRSE